MADHTFRDWLILRRPTGFAPRRVAGADLFISRESSRTYAGIVVLGRRS